MDPRTTEPTAEPKVWTPKTTEPTAEPKVWTPEQQNQQLNLKYGHQNNRTNS